MVGMENMKTGMFQKILIFMFFIIIPVQKSCQKKDILWLSDNI